MKTLHTLLRVVLVDPPTAFDGMDDVEPMLEEKLGPVEGRHDDKGNVHFETRYTYLPTFKGPALKREGDGRLFVFVGWYGTRTCFRRLKIHLDAVPNLIWDGELTVAGWGADGGPAGATAVVLDARNVEA